MLNRFTDYLDLQRKLATLDQLLKHVEGAPADPRVRLRLGDVFQGLQRIDEAVVQYREAAFLLSKRGFDKQARAVRALILSLIPGDAATIDDLLGPLPLRMVAIHESFHDLQFRMTSGRIDQLLTFDGREPNRFFA